MQGKNVKSFLQGGCLVDGSLFFFMFIYIIMNIYILDYNAFDT